jgi:hypothetical protein
MLVVRADEPSSAGHGVSPLIDSPAAGRGRARASRVVEVEIVVDDEESELELPRKPAATVPMITMNIVTPPMIASIR